jgi:hypothetical protein
MLTRPSPSLDPDSRDKAAGGCIGKVDETALMRPRPDDQHPPLNQLEVSTAFCGPR